jgi:hypothetical protein
MASSDKKITEVPFAELENADLWIDCIYKGGLVKNIGSEVLSRLMRAGNSGGFRKVLSKDKNRTAYVVLFTSMEELEWPDYLDEETGIFRYYGDNRKPGQDIHNTKKNGNILLRDVFEKLNFKSCQDIPPFFIFKKHGTGRDVKFLGLAAPGNRSISPDRDLVAFWRTMGDNRFQNYEAYFTILDTGEKPISRKWLHALVNEPENADLYAPEAWKEFVAKGREGIIPLKAPRIKKIPSRIDQLQMDEEGRVCINKIREFCSQDNYVSFEACATDIICKMDNNFIDFSLTRPWRDGGRDAIGHYQITQKSKSNYPLKIDCALEAKCYAEDKPVGVREMSRLISRIRYRQFGIFVTTSYVNNQAYSEVIDDGHPILIITRSDIASILRHNNINSNNINPWLESVVNKYHRLP